MIGWNKSREFENSVIRKTCTVPARLDEYPVM